MGKIRFSWLKVMYLWTIISAGGFGLGLLAAPGMMQAMNGWPSQDPILLGITGSMLVAFALVSILGYWSPLKFVPVFLGSCSA
jgi:ABC-type Fe3+-siderophore transport system permease subunit